MYWRILSIYEVLYFEFLISWFCKFSDYKMSEGCSNIGAKVIIVHTDFDRSYAHVDSEEEFSDDETDDMMQAELRQICRLGNKAMLKTFLVDNSEIDLDMMDPEGELHIKKTDTPDWQVYDIAAGKTVLNDRGSPRSSHQDCPVWWDSGDIVWARGRVWGWWTASGTHPCTVWFCTTPPPCRLWTSCCRRGLM